MSDFDPYLALSRAIERENYLLLWLQRVLEHLDNSSIGPASNVLPHDELERIISVIEMSENELTLLDEQLELDALENSEEV